MSKNNNADDLENFNELEGKDLSEEIYFNLVEKELTVGVLSEREEQAKLMHGLNSGNIKLEDAAPAITKKIEKNGLGKN